MIGSVVRFGLRLSSASSCFLCLTTYYRSSFGSLELFGAIGAMPPKRPKAEAVDLEDVDVDNLLCSHVKATHVTSNTAADDLWKYAKSTRSHKIHWGGIYKHRAILMDMVCLSRGRLVKMRKFEDQVFLFFASVSPGVFSRDAISLICRHPDN